MDWEKILAELGHKKDDLQDRVIATIHSLKARPEKAETKTVDRIPGTVLTALGLKADASETEVVGTIHSLKGSAAGATELVNRIATLEGKTTEREAEQLIATAHSAGKLTDAMVDWARAEIKAGRLEQLRGFLKDAPVIVPLGMRQHLTAAEHAAHGRGDDNPATLDDTQRAINKQLGVTDDRWTKHFAGSKS